MDIVFANEAVIQQIAKTGHFNEMSLVVVPKNIYVDDRVSMHTDLSVYIGEKIHIAPSIYATIYKQLTINFGMPFCESHLIRGYSEPGATYPHDIAYNILNLGEHMFHSLKHSEPTVLMETKRAKVDVKQGYSRCSCMPIGNRAIITEDLGLGKKVAEKGYDVLFLERGHIELEGFPYGFFGGSGGQIGEVIVFNGCLSNHPEGDKIRSFIADRGFKVVELNEGKLRDCGSILHFHRSED